MIFDQTVCSLGEGPLWHPLRQSLFWFDINNKRLFERGLQDDSAVIHPFKEHVSAAGWVDETSLLIASETCLSRLDLKNDNLQAIIALESDNPATRSNDGRTDPQGGFWIATMGKNAEPEAGAIYRYYQGELRVLFPRITIGNSICFAPSGDLAYFCDTTSQKIMQVALDHEGWPAGAPTLFVDVAPHNPDGSVVDCQGNLWNAQWGAHRVACYSPDGVFLQAVPFEAAQISCPAFGGDDMTTLFATSATQHMEHPAPPDGQTFVAQPRIDNQPVVGQQEHRVLL